MFQECDYLQNRQQTFKTASREVPLLSTLKEKPRKIYKFHFILHPLHYIFCIVSNSEKLQQAQKRATWVKFNINQVLLKELKEPPKVEYDSIHEITERLHTSQVLFFVERTQINGFKL